MNKCQACGKEVTGDYPLCIPCNIKNKEANTSKKISDTLEKLNWNIGFICEIWKRQNPEIAKEIEKDWKKKKEE